MSSSFGGLTALIGKVAASAKGGDKSAAPAAPTPAPAAPAASTVGGGAARDLGVADSNTRAGALAERQDRMKKDLLG